MTPSTRSPDFANPYPSARSAVLGRNVVATSQPLAAQAGLRMLLAGGNAVDAAIAAAMTLTVVEPTGCGLGSDGFAIVWDGRELHGLNASGRSPAGWTADRYAGRAAMPETGWDAVTVPGAVSAWSALSKRFGRLAFADLAAPAIGYARNGFAVSPVIARLWAMGGREARRPARLRRLLPARRPRTARRRDLPQRGPCRHARSHRRKPRRGLLPRRAGAPHGRACAGLRRRRSPRTTWRRTPPTGAARWRSPSPARWCTSCRRTARASPR